MLLYLRYYILYTRKVLSLVHKRGRRLNYLRLKKHWNCNYMKNDFSDTLHRELNASRNFSAVWLNPSHVIGKRLIDIYFHTDGDIEELQLIFEDGKQIEICLTEDNI